MASPLSVKKNNYLDNPKKSDIYTPAWLSQWIYDLVEKSGMKKDVVLDPAIGMGSLTNPFKENGSYILGIDIDVNSMSVGNWGYNGKFEDITEGDWNLATSFAKKKDVDIIVCNPPFNSASGRKLYPEVFLKKIEDMFGNKIPVIMIVPMGMRLNQRLKSSRWKYIRDNWKICSIISLPIDVFDNVLFHAEILCFNVTGMEPCYFIPEPIIPIPEG